MVYRQTSCLPEAGIPALVGRCLLATYSSIWGTAGLQQILRHPSEEFPNKTYPWVQESPQTVIHLDESEKKIIS